MNTRLKLGRIARAARSIDPVFLDTPQYRAESLDAVVGCRVVVKVETINPIRSFKGRGACYLVSQVPDGVTLVCASAGNFGQAMAYACRPRGLKLLVFAGEHANPWKLGRMRALGAEVQLHGQDFDAAKLAAKRFASERVHCQLVEDSLEPASGEGAATMAVELLRWTEPFDAAVVSLGNGAMLTGLGRWLKAHSPRTQVIGICASGAPAMAESWRSGRVVQHDSVHTIAEGIAVRLPIPEVLADMKSTVDDVLLVSDEALLRAMGLLHEHLGLVVEPSGAAGLAALLEFPERFRDRLVATVVCGGNLTPEQIRKWLSA